MLTEDIGVIFLFIIEVFFESISIFISIPSSCCRFDLIMFILRTSHLVFFGHSFKFVFILLFVAIFSFYLISYLVGHSGFAR